MSDPHDGQLFGGRAFAKNTLWNLAGQAIPLAVALLAIPLLIAVLGVERFGVLSLAWMFIGYFSLFDFGVGLAVTKLVAEARAGSARVALQEIVWTAWLILAAFGLVGGAVAFLAARFVALEFLKISPSLQDEAMVVFYLLAISIPLVVVTSGLRGVLEGFQRFDLTNVVRVPLGIFSFVGPLATTQFSHSLIPVTIILIVARVTAAMVYVAFCARIVPGVLHRVKISLIAAKDLASFGGWATVSNIVGPLMVYFDRFLVGGLMSVAAVVYYAVPYDVITRLLVIPAAAVTALFPLFSSRSVATDSLFSRGVRYVYIVLFPIVFLVVVLAPEGLAVWLGADFAARSTVVLQLLAIGVFFNGLAHVPFSFLQAIGRPDLTAKLHVAELPLYLAALAMLVHWHGIEGAAVAWAGRAMFDCAILFAMAHRFIDTSLWTVARNLGVVVLSCSIIGLGIPLTTLFTKLALITVVLLFFGAAAWRLFLTAEERVGLLKMLHLQQKAYR